MNGHIDGFASYFGDDYLGDDSDPEASGTESSDDDIDILLHGTPEQKRRLCQRDKGRGAKSASEDEFEKEMNAELNIQVKKLEKHRHSLSAESEPQQGTSTEANKDEEPQKYYDDIYFDSDEEEMVTEGDARCKRKQLSNDDLLYDPGIDADNEKWVQNQRRKCLQEPVDRKTTNKPLPNSDAVLNCPACMTTLCLDCQRHHVYRSQYRAMFVKNCMIDTSELMTHPQSSSKKKKKQKTSATPEDARKDQFNPVKCAECNTVVAVYGHDELYHFFNVLASY